MNKPNSVFVLYSKYLEFMLFPVDDDSGDLLVHEDEDGTEQSWDQGDHRCPPWVWSNGADEPTTIISGGLENTYTSQKIKKCSLI